MSTFFFPNFQFQDKALDVKYNPSFIVLQIQGKLIITCLGSLFASFGGSNFPLILQISSTSIVLFILAMASAKLKPCLIRKINLWDTGLYLLVAYLNACALFVILTKNSIVGVIALAGGGSAILIGTLGIHRKIYGPFNCFKCKKKNKVHNEEEDDEHEEDENEEEDNEEVKNGDDEKTRERNEKEERKKEIERKKKKKAVNLNGKIIVKNPEDFNF